LIRTMYSTHSIKYLADTGPFMPSLPLAIGFSFALQHLANDVPTANLIRWPSWHQMNDPRAGITALPHDRSILSPSSPDPARQCSTAEPPFFCPCLKIIYDLMLYRNFKSIKPPEEKNRSVLNLSPRMTVASIDSGNLLRNEKSHQEELSSR